jgi:hypothetical protein
MNSQTSIDNIRTAYMKKWSPELLDRVYACKETAEGYIYSYINKLLSTRIPYEGENLLWNEALAKACDKGRGYIDIPITDIQETIQCDYNNLVGKPYDYINIIKGHCIINRDFVEPIYVGGTPTLQSLFENRIEHGLAVDVNIVEKRVRISIVIDTDSD